MKGKYLITTDSWFYAPNGKQYKAAWGEVEVFEDSILGIKTNRNASNWYLKVGSLSHHVLIAGCQIHYAVMCSVKPNNCAVMDWSSDSANGCREYSRPTAIYIAE
jgi:hypothetical protein